MRHPKYLRSYFNLQSGITILELAVVVTIIGTIGLVILSHHATKENHKQVAAAIYEANQLRRGLTNYTVDYSHYPTKEREVVLDLVTDVRDDRGYLLMKPVFGTNFKSFRYVPDPDGRSYRIEVTALDRHHTKIITTPKGTRLEHGNLASRMMRYLP